MKPAFKQLTDCLDLSFVQQWTRQECVAMENCSDNLKIYNVVLEIFQKFY